MKNWTVWLLVWACIACAVVSANPRWPTISGDVSATECADGLRLAQTIFNSDAQRLYAPPIAMDGLESELVLQPTLLDTSGGHVLEENPDVFDQLPIEGGTHSLYWAKTVQDHVRLVVQESSAGWRGDIYALYTLPAELDKEDFLAKLADASTQPPALISNAWRPPLVFSTKSTGRMWFIDVGQPYVMLSSWKVYHLSAGPSQPVCTIQFRPPTEELVGLLPDTVVSFSQLVDQTIGTGVSEGPLQPTLNLRVNVRHVWGNVALRPWAVSAADVYNSREQVETGLQIWSRSNRSRLRLYKKILAAYPVALHALSDYYVESFSLSQEKAQALAEYVLDIALRANYTFPIRSNDPPDQRVDINPWKHPD